MARCARKCPFLGLSIKANPIHRPKKYRKYGLRFSMTTLLAIWVGPEGTAPKRRSKWSWQCSACAKHSTRSVDFVPGAAVRAPYCACTCAALSRLLFRIVNSVISSALLSRAFGHASHAIAHLPICVRTYHYGRCGGVFLLARA